MCKDFTDAMENGNTNFLKLGESINQLKIPCRYKGAFVAMADDRGFRFTNTTLYEMEEIGKTNSNTLINLLDGKKNGIGVPYLLATYLKKDKHRAMVLQLLAEDKQSTTETNVLKAILTVKHRENIV